jgi:hypothetical protein
VAVVLARVAPGGHLLLGEQLEVLVRQLPNHQDTFIRPPVLCCFLCKTQHSKVHGVLYLQHFQSIICTY